MARRAALRCVVLCGVVHCVARGIHGDVDALVDCVGSTRCQVSDVKSSSCDAWFVVVAVRWTSYRTRPKPYSSHSVRS